MAQKRFCASVYSVDRNKQTTSVQSATLLTTGVTYKVLARDSDTAETLLATSGPTGSAVTSKTNPVTTTVFEVDGQIEFVCDPTDTTYDKYVDLIVTDTNGGFTAFVEDFSPDIHAIYIDETPGVVHHGMIWFSASDNVATDTGVNFLPDTIVHDVKVEVVTVDATETISVGTADTAAGFRTGVSVANAGYIADTAVITSGTNADYWTVSTYGTLLMTAITGADTNVTTLGGRTDLYGHIVTTSGVDDDLYYTGSAGSDTAAGYLHYWLQRLR